MSAYDIKAADIGESSLANVKKFVEEFNVYDASIYPAHLAICSVLCVWLQKAHNARTNLQAYNVELAAPKDE